MPKEHKKRGQREEKKRKRQEVEDEQTSTPKRLKPQSFTEATEIKLDVPDYTIEGPDASFTADAKETPFYGLLGEEEQAYFKRVDQMLELNQFADPDERNLFLASVWREANGKELKIVNSQSCSRLMERLIGLSSPTQLKALFLKLSGHFLALVQHRFASHCCEALFIRSAPIVTEELLEPLGDEETTSNTEGSASMESLFLRTISELEENMGYLMTDSFGSHALRVLLVVLSGRSLVDASTTSLLQSKKKEHNETSKWNSKSQELARDIRTVPASFEAVLAKINSNTVGGLDPNYLRALALQPLANPVLQLLLEIEFMKSGKQKAKDESSLFRKLVAEEVSEEDTSSQAFLKGLLYDPVGSHLLESIVQCAPGRSFKAIYRSLLREELGNIVKNETAGFVVAKALERLSAQDLDDAVQKISSEIPMLIDRSRTSIIKTLIERCRVRHLETGIIAEAIKSRYGSSTNTMSEMLKFKQIEVDNIADDRKAQMETADASKPHASLLAQCMLEYPGPLREVIVSSLLAMDPSSLVLMAKDRSASHVLQASLVCREQTQSFRRKLLQQLKGHVTELAIDIIGSHVIDVSWNATHDLQFIREQVAEELAADEVAIKDTYPGRAVWRNWMMDIFKRGRSHWIQKSKDKEEGDASIRIETVPENSKAKKKGIEEARKRFAARHQGKGTIHREKDQRTGTGKNPNVISLGTERLKSTPTRKHVITGDARDSRNSLAVSG